MWRSRLRRAEPEKQPLTVPAASYLHYEMGYNVAIIDCDFPQHSIHSMRQRDLKMAMEDEFYREMAYEQFSRLDGKAYPVLRSNTDNAIVGRIFIAAIALCLLFLTGYRYWERLAKGQVTWRKNRVSTRFPRPERVYYGQKQVYPTSLAARSYHDLFD